MAAIVHMLMSLLLLSFIPTGVNGGDSLVFTERAYAITVPCEEDLACLHIWQLNTSRTSKYVAIVSTGESRTATSEAEHSKCTLEIKDLTAEDVGRHRCQQRPGVFSQTSPELNLRPGRTVSLQCILLSFIKGHCYARKHQVHLTWVDEAGAKIQEDPQHQIKQESPCNVTLTVTFQSSGDKKFRCQATVGNKVQTSVGLQVRVPALKGRRRGLIIEPENQGGNRDAIGAAVGVVGCVVLAALVALFVVNRRRGTRGQLPDESCYTTSTNNVINADDDVVYADIIHPVDPGRAWVLECESTEYACVRYT